MAKKNKKANKIPLTKGAKKLGRDFMAADELANRLGLNPDMDQVDLSREQAWADPTSDAFVGKRSDESKDYLEGLRNQVENAGRRSQEMQSTLDLMKGGLAGLNAQENLALRSAAQAEINRQYQGSVRKLQEAQTKGRVFGASRTAQLSNLDRSQAQQKTDFERDLLVKNIDIQDKRRNDYLAANRNVEQDEYTRTKDTLSAYGDAMGSAQKSEYDRMIEAQNALQKGVQTNFDLKNKAKLGRIGNIAGFTDIIDSRKAAKREYEIAKGGLSNQRRATEASKSSSDNYLKTMGEIYKNTYGEDPPA